MENRLKVDLLTFPPPQCVPVQVYKLTVYKKLKNKHRKGTYTSMKFNTFFKHWG